MIVHPSSTKAGGGNLFCSLTYGDSFHVCGGIDAPVRDVSAEVEHAISGSTWVRGAWTFAFAR